MHVAHNEGHLTSRHPCVRNISHKTTQSEGKLVKDFFISKKHLMIKGYVIDSDDTGDETNLKASNGFETEASPRAVKKLYNTQF